MRKHNIMARGICATLIMMFLVMTAGCASQERKIIEKFKAKDMMMTEVAGAIAQVVPGTSSVRVKPFDFIAIDGDYNMNWPGPPRRKLDWGSVEYYKPQVTLESPAPCDFTVCFWIKEDISWWFDKELGYFSVTIRQGSQNPVDSDITCPAACCGVENPPQNSPPNSIGSFWLGCTKKGKVKGNEDKNGREAKVYMEIFSIADTHGANVDWDYTSKQSPRHSIKCK